MTPRRPREDLLLGVGVHGRQRIVEDQDARIDDDGARERGALLLAARQRDAPLADHRVVAVRKVGDVLVEPRDGGGGEDAPHPLVARLARPTRTARDLPAADIDPPDAIQPERHVVRQRVGEQERLLRHEADGAAEDGERRSRTSTPSTKTVPGGGSYRRGEQADERRLARAGRRRPARRSARPRCAPRRGRAPAGRRSRTRGRGIRSRRGSPSSGSSRRSG